jgi:hypothetical protein
MLRIDPPASNVSSRLREHLLRQQPRQPARVGRGSCRPALTRSLASADVNMALCYVYDFESLSSIARRYGVSRSLVSDRLDHFWDSHDGHEMVRARSEEMGIDDPLDPCECARCEAERETLARASNGRGSALHITG